MNAAADDRDNGGTSNKAGASNNGSHRNLHSEETSKTCRRRGSELLLRELRRQSAQLRPETTTGYTTVAALLAALSLAYEVRLQRQLTAPPIVYGQLESSREPKHQSHSSGRNRHPFSQILAADVYQAMIQHFNGDQRTNIIQRPIQPSLVVGTRAILSSTVAYLIQHDEPSRLHPSTDSQPTTAAIGEPQQSSNCIQFREVMKMPSDGATIAIDWEFPFSTDDRNCTMSIEQWKLEILQGPISKPVVLILHGINNHTGFGYMQNMMHLCCRQGWIAAGMNFRGCSVPPSTPRSYNGAYTGDLRAVVQKLAARLLQSPANSASSPTYQPLFIVGNSLGANLVAKYLGEEGRCDTLPPCVAGGVTMGNPMKIDSRTMSPIFSPVIALGAKRGLYATYPTLKAMIQSSAHFQQCVQNAWKAVTLADYDRAMAPIFCRNDPSEPFAYRVGYHSAEDYWKDASSYRQVPFITVPFLQLIARDDFLTYHPFRKHLYCNVMNPYVMVMETTCGGHLGWHEAVTQPRATKGSWDHFLFGSSWADSAMAEFIQATLDVYVQRQSTNELSSTSDANDNEKSLPSLALNTERATKHGSTTAKVAQIRSRL
jgi:predicted alpha/beta-fold hydrolase